MKLYLFFDSYLRLILIWLLTTAVLSFDAGWLQFSLNEAIGKLSL